MPKSENYESTDPCNLFSLSNHRILEQALYLK